MNTLINTPGRISVLFPGVFTSSALSSVDAQAVPVVDNKHSSTTEGVESKLEKEKEKEDDVSINIEELKKEKVNDDLDDLEDMSDDELDNMVRFFTDNEEDKKDLRDVIVSTMPSEIEFLGQTVQPVNMGFRTLISFALSGLGGTTGSFIRAIGLSKLADRVPELLKALTNNEIQNKFKKKVVDIVEKKGGITKEQLEELSTQMRRDEVKTVASRSLPVVAGAIVSGVSARLSSGSLNTGLITSGLSAGTGMMAQEGTERILNKLNVSDTTKKVLPPLVGLTTSLLTEPLISSAGGTIGSTQVLPTQIVQSQLKGTKRKWKPRTIIPASDIVELTEQQAILNQIEYSLFDYVVEGSEGGNGTSNTNPLMKNNQVEEDIRFLGWQQTFAEKELEYKKNKVNKVMLPSQSIENWNQSQFEEMPKVISPGLMSYNTPYGDFTQTVLTNQQLKTSILYGVCP